MKKKDKSLNKNKNFKYVYNKGSSMVSSLLVTYVLKNKSDMNRIGITASKKIGNAVNRNRARRIIRAAFRNCKFNLKQGYDIVFVARRKTVRSNSYKIYSVMIKQLEKLGCLKNN